MLGIIGAMDEEVAKLKEKMEQVHIVEKAGMQFYRGSLCDREVVIVKCGVGKVHAAMCTQAMIDLFPVDGIVNTGIAGSLNAEINIGDIVLAKDALEHDMDVSALGYGPGINPDLKEDENIFKTDVKMLEIALAAAKQAELSVNIFTGRVVSGDQFISSKDKKKWLVDTFDGTCTEMEGASIGHVSIMNKVPYLVIRAISDKADDSAEMDYPSFAAMAINNSVALMTEFIKLC